MNFDDFKNPKKFYSDLNDVIDTGFEDITPGFLYGGYSFICAEVDDEDEYIVYVGDEVLETQDLEKAERFLFEKYAKFI